jgi:hypothetical protein
MARDHIPGAAMVGNLYDQYMSQRSKQDYYRNIEGGTQGNALVERMNEFQYGLQGFGVLSGAEAEQAFKGVTRIGYTNRTEGTDSQTRQDALDLIYNGKSSRGQSVEEGLRQVQIASKSSEVNLKGLNKALEELTENAGKAGVNTEMVRTQMMGLLDLGIGQGLGNGAVGMAQSVTQTNSSYGRAYMSKVDSSNVFSRDMEYRAASMSGMSAGQLRNLKRRDPGRAMGILGKAMDASLESAGITPEMRQWIKDTVASYGGAQVIREQPDVAAEIANQFLDQFLDKLNDPNAFVDVLSRLSGTDFGGNIEAAAQFVVEQVAGNSMADTAAKTQAKVQKHGLNAKSLDDFNSATIQKHDAFGLTGFDQSKAAQAYVAGANKSGQQDPIIESLLKDSRLMGDKGDKQMVKVMTKNGPRVVPLDEAVKNFSGEIAAGKVQFMNGEAEGLSVADITGSVNAKADWQSEAKRAYSGGQSVADWQKNHPGQDANRGTPTTAPQIGLTPEAAKYLRIVDPSQTSASASTGYPSQIPTQGSPPGRG